VITSNLSRTDAPGNVLLKLGDGNLPKASVVNVSQILTVDKTELVEYVGRLGADAMAAVREGLHLVFDSHMSRRSAITPPGLPPARTPR